MAYREPLLYQGECHRPGPRCQPCGCSPVPFAFQTFLHQNQTSWRVLFSPLGLPGSPGKTLLTGAGVWTLGLFQLNTGLGLTSLQDTAARHASHKAGVGNLGHAGRLRPVKSFGLALARHWGELMKYLTKHRRLIFKLIILYDL